MKLRSPLLRGGLIPVLLLSLVACGGTAATSAPGTRAPATPAPTASAPAPTAAAPAPTTPGAVGGGAGGLDAGALVTAEIAGSIIGGTPTRINLPGGVAGGAAMSVVAYTNTGGDNMTVLVEQIPGSFATGMLQAAIQSAGGQGDLKPVSGLGDSAGQVTNEHDATVAFAKGNSLVVLAAAVDALGGADIEAKLEALARQLAGTL